MKDIWELFEDLNIHKFHHVYKEINRTTNCFTNKGIDIVDSKGWLSNFSKDVNYINFVDYYESLSNCLVSEWASYSKATVEINLQYTKTIS